MSRKVLIFILLMGFSFVVMFLTLFKQTSYTGFVSSDVSYTNENNILGGLINGFLFNSYILVYIIILVILVFYFKKNFSVR